MSYEFEQGDVHTLFERSKVVRPSICELARIATAGATEADILSAAEDARQPIPYKAALERILVDADTLLPYADILAVSLAREFPDKRIVFAGRDGEMMADLFAIRRPDHSSALLPASMDLWTSGTVAVSDLAVPFFTNHGLDKQTVESKEAVLFDTGFAGNVGKQVWRTLAMHYGGGTFAGLFKSEGFYRRHLPLRMVAANDNSRVAKSQLEFGLAPNESWRTEHFPFSHTAISGSSGGVGKFMNFAVAIAMQLQPRYHGSYEKLERQDDGTVIAAPKNPIPATGEHKPYDPNARQSNNNSIVNSVAAACVQLRVARHALMLPPTRIAEICDPIRV